MQSLKKPKVHYTLSDLDNSIQENYPYVYFFLFLHEIYTIFDLIAHTPLSAQ